MSGDGLLVVVRSGFKTSVLVVAVVAVVVSLLLLMS